MNNFPVHVRCLRDVHRGISLIGNKVYAARAGQKGWFAIIDETGEEYAYPPELFEVVEAVAEPVQEDKTTVMRELVY
ncbi:MAG: hypothetical protein FWF44_10685 [Defluviitaleaceae bacterium]|nr:hypothetical protein [Defluviitaleaceae bacterium]